MANTDQALEFCALISAKESAPSGSPALAVLDDARRAELDALLRRYTQQGANAELERQARVFLTKYQEWVGNAGILNAQESGQLTAILRNDDGEPVFSLGGKMGVDWLPARTPAAPRTRHANAVFAFFLACLLAIAVSLAVSFLHHSTTGQSVGSGAVPRHPAAQQVPPAPTDLQKTESLLGPWRTISPSSQRPQTGAPAVLLLASGGYEASQSWTVPAGAQGWQADSSGSIGDITMHGTWVAITDADSVPYVAGTGQPFILASTPGMVFRISQDGTPMTISLAQAVAARHHL